MAEQDMTDLQRAWLAHYLVSLNATDAARRAGYDCENAGSYRVIGHENLVKLRPVIDARLRELLPSPEAVLRRIEQIAFADVGPFIGEDGLLDIHGLVEAEQSYLVTGIGPVRDGIRYDLADQLAALKMLARYHKLLSSDVTVRVEAEEPVTKDVLDSLVAQVMALEAQAAAGQ